jgi:hypothetical protein
MVNHSKLVILEAQTKSNYTELDRAKDLALQSIKKRFLRVTFDYIGACRSSRTLGRNVITKAPPSSAGGYKGDGAHHRFRR